MQRMALYVYITKECEEAAINRNTHATNRICVSSLKL